jgi:hydrogenase maturation factor HypF (carbamoyltransferase family)
MRKRRGDKPFAVMVADLAGARRIADIDAASARVLSGPQRPIVLVPRRSGAPLADAVAPRNPDVGVMLAYTPLHALLFGLPGDPPGPQVLVMTSGNLGGEPICYTDDDALTRLAGLADGWLLHDRAILVPCDDSVVRMTSLGELPVRRSRGYAPLPIALPVPVPPTLAVGADLKNTMAVGDGTYAWLSQHIGDMDDLATLSAFDAAQRHLRALTGVSPRVLVADAHPLYRSSAWARRNGDGRPVRTVQHHHAHIAAVMAEHGLDGSRPVLGFAFDGTHQLETGFGCVPTSSMGRLFDAVSALAGIRQTVAYEAQAAIELEGLSRGVDQGSRWYAFAIDRDCAPMVIDPAPVLAAVIADLRAGVAPGVIGARFHDAVAAVIVELADADPGARHPVALSGGVFQNALLLVDVSTRLRAKGFDVITHRVVPPNDGGIALGQLLVGTSS